MTCRYLGTYPCWAVFFLKINYFILFLNFLNFLNFNFKTIGSSYFRIVRVQVFKKTGLTQNHHTNTNTPNSIKTQTSQPSTCAS
jgi:hypothetical protein